MSCNKELRGHNPSVMSSFQSLSGFLMSCNDIVESDRAIVGKFQSLSGFLMSCNLCMAGRIPIILYVSIPIGFSNEL